MKNNDAKNLMQQIADLEKRLSDLETKPQHHEPLYSSLLSVRNTELAAYWTRYNIQTVINFGLLALIIRFVFPLSDIPLLIPIVGMVLAIIWLSFVLLSKRLIIEEWDQCVKNYESVLAKQGVCRNILILSEFKNKEKNKNYFKRNWHNLNFVACTLPILCGLAWYLILLLITYCSLSWGLGLGIPFWGIIFYLVWALTRKNFK